MSSRWICLYRRSAGRKEGEEREIGSEGIGRFLLSLIPLFPFSLVLRKQFDVSAE